MIRQIPQALKNFFATESAGGIVLLLAALSAIILANSPSDIWFNDLLYPYHGFINEGLMSIFFFLVGLELKREFQSGELRNLKNALLPIIAAIGGMAVPAAIYSMINAGSAGANGWVIPIPTDIALAIGALALLGSRIDMSLKIFLLTVAIMDDLFSIVILGIFYSDALSPLHIASTIGAVLLAFLIPQSKQISTERLINWIHPWTAFLIIPLFALANLGLTIDFSSLGSDITSKITLGIILGFVPGKVIGITFFAWLSVKLGIARLPSSLSIKEIAGAGLLAGMGLTISLFMAKLAMQPAQLQDARLGIIVASVISALLGITWLYKISIKQD